MHEIRWKARSYKDEDFEKASKLRALFSDRSTKTERRSFEPEYYRWKILKNPFKTGIFHVADDNEKVVGMLSIIPKRIYFDGKLLYGAELCDAFVDPAHQRQGMFIVLLNTTREESIEKNLDLIYGTPNKQALAGEKKAGYDLIPSAKVYNLIRPLNFTSVLENKFQKKMIVKLLSPIISLGYKLIYPVRFPELEKKGLVISMVPEFPEDIHALWKKTSKTYDWILERSKKYLDWRFVQNPDTYSIFLAKINKVTIGYLVTKIGIWKNLRIGYLADFLIDEKGSEIFRDLVFHSFLSFQDANVDLIAAWACKDGIYYDVLKQLGFRQHKPIPIICYKNELGKYLINHSGKWHFTIADSDNV